MRYWAFVFVPAAFLAACSGPSAVDSPDAGRTVSYEPGVPNFDMESVVRLADETAVVDVYFSIPLSSLMFVQSDGKYSAEYEAVVQLTDREMGGAVSEETVAETLSVSTYDSTISHHPHFRRVTLTAPPGEYVADVSLTDAASGASARRRQAVQIAEPESGDAFISRPLLEVRRGDADFQPVVSMHLPGSMDSLRASINLYNLSDEAPVEVTMRLVGFRTDTTVASPPYWLVPTRASIQYRGIDYGDVDTVQVSRRALESVGQMAVVVFSLPRLTAGVYLLEISAADTSGGILLERDRLLSVKSSSFPALSSLDDLVEALAYIAYDDEVEHIRDATSPVERKRRFDAFWGTLVQNRNLAASLIRLYYGRIEEANLFFTGYKEGWKTDRGMIYTILGPPIYVDRRVGVEVWHYSYGSRDPTQTFVFEKAAEQGDDPFETYILQRRPYYQHEWIRAVDRWRDGQVL